MERENIWHLKNFNIFKVMSDEQMHRLQDMITTDWIKRKSPVYLQGEPTRWVYFLKKGLVKLAINSESGKTVTVALLKPGEIFGELSLDGFVRHILRAMGIPRYCGDVEVAHSS